MLVTLLWMVVQRETVTVKVCLYPQISWGKHTFAEFQITTISHTSRTATLDVLFLNNLTVDYYLCFNFWTKNLSPKFLHNYTHVGKLFIRLWFWINLLKLHFIHSTDCYSQNYNYIWQWEIKNLNRLQS